MKLFLDATDFPPGDGQGWTIVRTMDEAVEWVLANGFPDFVSFNSDLGKDETEGNEFAFWLTEHDMDTGGMPDSFGYDIRGHNPAGDERIRGWIDHHLAERAEAKAAGLIWPCDLHKASAASSEPDAGGGPNYAGTEAFKSGEITFDDCCRLILEQGPPPREPVAPGKPDYRRDLLALLNKLFGIDWTADDDFHRSRLVWDADGTPWNGDVPYITSSLIRAYPNIVDPFARWLEYTPMMGERDVWKSHRAGLTDAATAMRQRFVAFFRDLLLLRWPEAAHRTTSWEQLRALGLVEPEFDPYDF